MTSLKLAAETIYIRIHGATKELQIKRIHDALKELVAEYKQGLKCAHCSNDFDLKTVCIHCWDRQSG